MHTIDEVVAVDDQATFRNDVQISLFDNQAENLALLKSYIFSVAAPNGGAAKAAKIVSSVDLLRQLTDAFASSVLENRFVAIANYGHGKSHLALALTNYFSKPPKSDEASIVLKNLDHAINDAAKSSFFREFKQNRGEFLVIRLRGDTPTSLREQFIPALEVALDQHAATQGKAPPLWHTYAETLLKGLGPEEKERANAQLAQAGHDVSTLLAAVKARKDVRDLCTGALTAAKNMVPNLGAQASLRETIEWVTDNLCGDGKPLGGLLVLLDEFSFYINRYAQRGAVGELQDLLNGVSNRPGRVVFLAFAQHDPMTVADNASISTHARDNLKHELTRIPKKLALYSLMEGVIDAYLRQREHAWAAFSSRPDIKDQLDWATHVAHMAFETRYAKELGWLTDQFGKIVTRGCFPLHPLTTALLCNLRFSAADAISDPRTVLGFIIEQRDRKLKDPLVTDDGRVNWVLPVDLVDYFEQRISQEWHTAYVNGRRKLTGLAREQRQLLKGLYLQHAADLTLSTGEQVEFLAQAAGMGAEQVNNLLASMQADNVIRFDAVKRTYSLWPADTDPGKLEALLSVRLAQPMSSNNLIESLNKYTRTNGYDAIAVNVPWGHSADWAAAQLVLTRETFTVDLLAVHVRQFAIKNGAVDEGNRGLVVWLLAQHEDDVAWFRDQAEEILDSAVDKNAPLPVVVVLPAEPLPDLVSALHRDLALESLTPAERTLVGQAIYDHERQQVSRALIAECDRFFGTKSRYLQDTRALSTLVVPIALRTTISSMPKVTLLSVLTQAYLLAYRYGPKDFFTHYQLKTKNLRDAVKAVAGILASERAESLATAISTLPIAVQIRDLYLVKAWGVLTPQFRVQAPTQLSVQRAWGFLDKSFAPTQGEVLIAKPLVMLLNPPFGYDYNTAVLIFTAWFAYHHVDLELRNAGRVVHMSRLGEMLQGGAKEFFGSALKFKLALQRRDMDRERKLVMELIKTNGVGIFDETQAADAVTKLTAYARDERNQPVERDAARDRANAIVAAQEASTAYLQSAQTIVQRARHSSDVQELVTSLMGLVDLPKLTLVRADAPTPSQLRDALLARLGGVVKAQADRLAYPKDATQVGLYRSQLTELRSAVEGAELTDLANHVKSALATLEGEAKRLERRELELVYLQRIQSISLTSNLSTLCEARDELKGYDIQSGDIGQECDAVVGKLNQEICWLEGYAVGLPSKCSGVTSRHVVDKLRDEIMKLQARFVGSAYEKLLADSLNQMDDLRAFFEEIDSLNRQTPQAQPDVDRFYRRVEALANQYQGKLSEGHRQPLDTARQRIERHVSDSRDRARLWFARLHDDAQRNMNLAETAQKLEIPPPFFPEDLRDSLRDLQADVQVRIDNDAILKVEQAFRQITGREKQEECLQRLAKIVHAGTTAAVR